MKGFKKLNGANSRNARMCTFLIAAVFVVLFYQVWRVHTFDVQAAVIADGHAVSDASVTASSSSKFTEMASSSSLLPAPLVAGESTGGKPDRWSDGEVVSALSSFYQTIISYMGMLVGVIGILAVLTLRFLSKAAAEDIAHESVKSEMQRYLKSREFVDEVEIAVEEAGFAKRLEKDLERLEHDLSIVKGLLKKQAAEQDNDESADGTVFVGTEGGGK